MSHTPTERTSAADLSEFWQEMDEALRAEPEELWRCWHCHEVFDWTVQAQEQHVQKHPELWESTIVFEPLWYVEQQATGGALVGEG